MSQDLDPTTVPEVQRELVVQPHGVRDHLAITWRRARGGDLGMIPVVAGIAVIWIVFQLLNPAFLSSTNLVNLSFDMVPVGVIALGIVCVLLVGEIDLSVGSVSGVSAAVTAVVFIRYDQPVFLAMVASVLMGCAVGLVYALVYNRFGVPSFVVSLAGLLALLGVQLWILRGQNAINLPYDSGMVKFAQLWFVPEWLAYLFAVLAAAGLFASAHARARARRKAGLGHRLAGGNNGHLHVARHDLEVLPRLDVLGRLEVDDLAAESDAGVSGIKKRQWPHAALALDERRPEDLGSAAEGAYHA